MNYFDFTLSPSDLSVDQTTKSQRTRESAEHIAKTVGEKRTSGGGLRKDLEDISEISRRKNPILRLTVFP